MDPGVVAEQEHSLKEKVSKLPLQPGRSHCDILTIAFSSSPSTPKVSNTIQRLCTTSEAVRIPRLGF